MNKYILYGIIAYIAYTFLKSKNTSAETPVNQMTQEQAGAAQIIQLLATQSATAQPVANIVDNTKNASDYMYIPTTTAVQPNISTTIVEPVSKIPISYQQYMATVIY